MLIFLRLINATAEYLQNANVNLHLANAKLNSLINDASSNALRQRRQEQNMALPTSDPQRLIITGPAVRPPTASDNPTTQRLAWDTVYLNWVFYPLNRLVYLPSTGFWFVHYPGLKTSPQPSVGAPPGVVQMINGEMVPASEAVLVASTSTSGKKQYTKARRAVNYTVPK